MAEILDEIKSEKKDVVRTRLVWGLRIFLSVMFLFSAFSKLYPSPALGLGTFEGKQLIPMGFSPDWAAIFSRTIVGGEFALGFGLLLPHYFRRLVIPAASLLLLIFTIHLSYQYFTNGNESNCGCFGSLMPFSTLESIFKNVVFLGLFGWLWRLTKGFEDKKVLWIPFVEVIGCIAIVSAISMKAEVPKDAIVVVEEPKTDISINSDNGNTPVSDPKENPVPGKTVKTDSTGKVKPVQVDEPKQGKSGFKNQYSDIDQGRKILCFFAPGCEHCKEAIRELVAIKKSDPSFPELKIIFMDEETDLIPAFFDQAGMKFTYKILDIVSFYTAMGSKNDTPNIYYIWNGNVIKSYSGTEERKFNDKEFKTLIQKKYSEIK